MGEAKAAQVKAALEIGRRLLLAQPEQRPQITSPADVANLLMVEMAHLEQEHLRVVLLNTKNYVLKIETVYIGSINSSAVRIGEVFKTALKQNSAAIIVVHNHPSGDPTPSPEDVAVTRQLVEAGKLLDVDVLDHLVIGQGRWVSLRERRLGFTA
jgi:DNA repair protein RadC